MVWALCGLVIVIIGLAVPEGDLSADDLRSAHFAVVPRGYSMRQVDQLLDRMAAQLEAAPKEGFADTAEHAPNGKGLDTE